MLVIEQMEPVAPRLSWIISGTIENRSPMTSVFSSKGPTDRIAQCQRWYTPEVMESYRALAQRVQQQISQSAQLKGTNLHMVTSRAKTLASLSNKATKPHPADPTVVKYADFKKEITDIAGVRVITYLQSDIAAVCEIVEACSAFDVVEGPISKGDLVSSEVPGYQSVHYLVRAMSPEASALETKCVEIQIRTILQHVWAEIGHQLDYKNVDRTISTGRKLSSLAGMLEIGDDEIQRIVDDSNERGKRIKTAVEGHADLSRFELTAKSLEILLIARFGNDKLKGSVARNSYIAAAQLLRESYGIHMLGQLDEILERWEDKRYLISKALSGSANPAHFRRIEEILLAHLGEDFIQRHPKSLSDPDWVPYMQRQLVALRRAGLATLAKEAG